MTHFSHKHPLNQRHYCDDDAHVCAGATLLGLFPANEQLLATFVKIGILVDTFDVAATLLAYRKGAVNVHGLVGVGAGAATFIAIALAVQAGF